MDDEVSHKDSMSHKGQKVRSYTLNFKLKAVEYAEINTIKAAANKFNIDRKRIREWVSTKDSLSSLKEKPKGAKRMRLNGGGRKPLNERMEEIIQEWIHERR